MTSCTSGLQNSMYRVLLTRVHHKARPSAPSHLTVSTLLAARPGQHGLLTYTGGVPLNTTLLPPAMRLFEGGVLPSWGISAPRTNEYEGCVFFLPVSPCQILQGRPSWPRSLVVASGGCPEWTEQTQLFVFPKLWHASAEESRRLTMDLCPLMQLVRSITGRGVVSRRRVSRARPRHFLSHSWALRNILRWRFSVVPVDRGDD